jgi:NAD(P)H-quinone oxidoreductase subunit 5
LAFFPAIAVYAGLYTAVTGVLSSVPLVTAPTDLTALHGVVVAVFLVVYLAMETGVHERSQRLYVALRNASQPPTSTLLTSREEYNEY